MQSKSDISIIIITHNREKLVKRCIESVYKAINCYSGRIEIIVVNSSKEALNLNDQMIQEIYVPNIPKPYEKRNIGLQKSKYEWLLYLDDDCIVDKEILNVLDENVRSSADNVAGFYGVTEFIGDMTYASRCCRNSNFTNIFKAPLHEREMAWGVAVSPLFRKEALVACNGYTENFTSSVGGEDLDIGVKLNEHGWKLLGIPVTLSYHEYETWNSYSGNIKRFFRYGMAETSVVLNHPDHIFFKLNSIVLLLLPIILDVILNFTGVINCAEKILLYIFTTALFSALYYTINNRVAFWHAWGLVFYDRAFEVGVVYSSAIIHRFKTLFYRFEYQKKKRLFGHNIRRNILIIIEWLSVILSVVVNHMLLG